MNKIGNFLREERLYILILIFVILMSVIVSTGAPHKAVKESSSYSETRKAKEELFLSREDAEEFFRQNRRVATLFSIVSLLIISMIFLGVVVDVVLLSSKLSGHAPDIRTRMLEPVGWNLWDVSKVAILFMFFGYMIIMTESALARVFPILKYGNFRMMLNSSMLDTLALVFIFYFSVWQYKEKLLKLGISFKNFLRNVFYGIVGYIAALPVLVVVLIITVIVTNLIKYTPQRQPVVELFLKEKNMTFLFYTSLFAAMVGPVVEELFFRGFMYTALRKYTGVFWSTVATAALFSTLHAHVVGTLPIFILGILLAYLYEKTGTIISSITVHVIHNLSMVVLVFLAKQTAV